MTLTAATAQECVSSNQLKKNPGFQVKTCMHVWNGVKAVQIHLCSHTTLHVDAEDLYNTGTLLFPFKYKASKLGKKVHQ